MPNNTSDLWFYAHTASSWPTGSSTRAARTHHLLHELIIESRSYLNAPLNDRLAAFERLRKRVCDPGEVLSPRAFESYCRAFGGGSDLALMRSFGESLSTFGGTASLVPGPASTPLAVASMLVGPVFNQHADRQGASRQIYSSGDFSIVGTSLLGLYASLAEEHPELKQLFERTQSELTDPTGPIGLTFGDPEHNWRLNWQTPTEELKKQALKSGTSAEAAFAAEGVSSAARRAVDQPGEEPAPDRDREGRAALELLTDYIATRQQAIEQARTKQEKLAAFKKMQNEAGGLASIICTAARYFLPDERAAAAFVATVRSGHKLAELVSISGDPVLQQGLGLGPFSIASGVVGAVTGMLEAMGLFGPNPNKVLMDSIRRVSHQIDRMMELQQRSTIHLDRLHRRTLRRLADLYELIQRGQLQVGSQLRQIKKEIEYFELYERRQDRDTIEDNLGADLRLVKLLSRQVWTGSSTSLEYDPLLEKLAAHALLRSDDPAVAGMAGGDAGDLWRETLRQDGELEYVFSLLPECAEACGIEVSKSVHDVARLPNPRLWASATSGWLDTLIASVSDKNRGHRVLENHAPTATELHDKGVALHDLCVDLGSTVSLFKATYTWRRELGRAIRVVKAIIKDYQRARYGDQTLFIRQYWAPSTISFSTAGLKTPWETYISSIEGVSHFVQLKSDPFVELQKLNVLAVERGDERTIRDNRYWEPIQVTVTEGFQRGFDGKQRFGLTLHRFVNTHDVRKRPEDLALFQILHLSELVGAALGAGWDQDSKAPYNGELRDPDEKCQRSLEALMLTQGDLHWVDFATNGKPKAVLGRHGRETAWIVEKSGDFDSALSFSRSMTKACDFSMRKAVRELPAFLEQEIDTSHLSRYWTSSTAYRACAAIGVWRESGSYQDADAVFGNTSLTLGDRNALVKTVADALRGLNRRNYSAFRRLILETTQVDGDPSLRQALLEEVDRVLELALQKFVVRSAENVFNRSDFAVGTLFEFTAGVRVPNDLETQALKGMFGSRLGESDGLVAEPIPEEETRTVEPLRVTGKEYQSIRLEAEALSRFRDAVRQLMREAATSSLSGQGRLVELLPTGTEAPPPDWSDYCSVGWPEFLEIWPFGGIARGTVDALEFARTRKGARGNIIGKYGDLPYEDLAYIPWQWLEGLLTRLGIVDVADFVAAMIEQHANEILQALLPIPVYEMLTTLGRGLTDEMLMDLRRVLPKSQADLLQERYRAAAKPGTLERDLEIREAFARKYIPAVSWNRISFAGVDCEAEELIRRIVVARIDEGAASERAVAEIDVTLTRLSTLMAFNKIPPLDEIEFPLS